MGCCGSKKKEEVSNEEPSEPPKPDAAPKPSEAQTLENQYQFQTPAEAPAEEVGPRKETIPDKAIECEQSVSVQEQISDEQCTPLQNPSPIAAKGELEPIEPVKIPLTSHLDSMGPGDKNNLIVRAPMLSANEASPSPHPSPSDLSPQSNLTHSKGGNNQATTDSYYTETAEGESEGETA